MDDHDSNQGKKKQRRAGAIRRAFDPAGVSGRFADELVASTRRARRASVDDVIPEVQPPDPSQLRARLPSREAPPSDDEVHARARAWLAEKLGRQRAFGAVVEADDQLVLTTLGFADGTVVPFTARFEEHIAAGEEVLPGVREAVTGKTVGESVVANVVIPSGVAGQPYAGQDINLVVEIVSARPRTEVELSESAVGASGLAPDLATLESRARGLLAGEQEAAWRTEARDAVLDAALGQRPVTVENSATAVLIEHLWRERELPVLERMKVPAEEQRALLQTWMDSHAIVADARLRLARTAIVRAYGRLLGVQADARTATRAAVESAPELSSRDRTEALADLMLGELPAAGDAAHWYIAALDTLVDDVIRAHR